MQLWFPLVLKTDDDHARIDGNRLLRRLVENHDGDVVARLVDHKFGEKLPIAELDELSPIWPSVWIRSRIAGT